MARKYHGEPFDLVARYIVGGFMNSRGAPASLPPSPREAGAVLTHCPGTEGGMTDELKALGHQSMPVLKAIRANCIECSGGSRSEVAKCQAFSCKLYPFRMGTNPWRKPRNLSPEQKAEMAKRLAMGRAGTEGVM